MYSELGGSQQDPKYKNFLEYEDSVIDTLNEFRETQDQKSGSKMDTEAIPTRAQRNSNIFGISNIGNTCFFNSTMQAMNATRELVQEYMDHKDEFNEYRHLTGSI